MLIVAITSNKGLCGGFNSNVIKEVYKLLQTEYSSKKAEIICIGKKGGRYFVKKKQCN